jgi:hypothetical protein
MVHRICWSQPIAIGIHQLVPDGDFSEKNGCERLSRKPGLGILTFSYLCLSMDRELRAQIASLILAFSLVLPMVVGLTHALHEHDQVICLAENESHIHSQGVDCDHEHYFNPGGVVEQVAPSENLIPGVAPIASWGDPCEKLNNLVPSLSLRGPPMINV